MCAVIARLKVGKSDDRLDLFGVAALLLVQRALALACLHLLRLLFGHLACVRSHAVGPHRE